MLLGNFIDAVITVLHILPFGFSKRSAEPKMSIGNAPRGVCVCVARGAENSVLRLIIIMLLRHCDKKKKKNR